MSVATSNFSTKQSVFPLISHNVKPQRIITADFSVPTNTFWTNLILNRGTDPIYVNPYILWFNGTGFNFNCDGLYATKDYVVTNRNVNFSIGTAAQKTFMITSYDNLSVQVSVGNLLYIFVRGSPFITVKSTNEKPTFTTIHGITALQKINTNKYNVVLNNGQTWLIYHEGGLNLTQTGNSINAVTSYNGIFRVILIPNSTNIVNIINNIDNYAKTYPSGGNISYSVENNTATLRYDWVVNNMNVTYSSNNLLMYALPHHIDTLTPQTNENLHTYVSIKGTLRPYIGNTWIMKLNLPTISFKATLGVDPKYHEELKTALQKDITEKPVAPDVYFYGKQISKVARIILIADEIGEINVKDTQLKALKTYVSNWINPSNNKFVYDNVWGGLITREGSKNPNADFGNGWYNDHHFHYGYFIYAIAVICKFDSSFYTIHKDAILDLVRDVANPNKTDKLYPITRCKDWYDGHSWANGIFSFGDSKNQESTSEAVNCYYALQLLGEAINNNEMVNLARVMLTTEIISSQKYWHIKDSSIYPQPFSQNKAVGVLWSTKVDHVTWFGRNIEFIHCIQMLPFTPISEALLDPVWIALQQPVLETSLTRKRVVDANGNVVSDVISDGWKGFVYMSKAINEPLAAYNWLKGFVANNGKFDDGNSYSNTLYWILTRPGLGIDRKVIPDPNPNPNPNPNPDNTLTINKNSNIKTLILDGVELNIIIRNQVVLKYN